MRSGQRTDDDADDDTDDDLELLLNCHQVDIATQSVIGNRNRV